MYIRDTTHRCMGDSPYKCNVYVCNQRPSLMYDYVPSPIRGKNLLQFFIRPPARFVECPTAFELRVDEWVKK